MPCCVLSLILFCIVGCDAFRLLSPRLLHQPKLRPPSMSLDTTSNDLIPVTDHTNGQDTIDINAELKSSFMSYAMSTILGRALPDARDGLKPVHRRVLFAMHSLGLTPDSSYRKCARIVGEVLGKFHPHGDQSVYDALVRMAQDFVMMHPLVAGHGNFGSIDNDPPAAMRYTEAKLSQLAFDSLLVDIKEDTVDFTPNFDGNEEEPFILPARLPILLINGASGIAVGMATNIPPHNLGEIVDAMVALINDPDLSEEDLARIVPAPDFPTGGFIQGLAGAKEFETTGHGSILMRAKTHIEQIANNGKSGARPRTAIIVTELPYMTNKAALLEKIADLVNDKKLEGISDLRDESDRNGIRVVIELKKDAIPEIVQNNLFKKTALQTAFSGNFVALAESGTQPKRLNLKSALVLFLQYRFQTIRRRTAFQLSKLKSRNHIVMGLMTALSKIDDIINIIKNSADTQSAKDLLFSEPYNFSVEQAEAILSLTLRRLTALEENKLKEEHEDLVAQISKLENLMLDDNEINHIIITESMALKNKHAIPRRTEIIKDVTDFTDEDLLANERSVIITTRSGYIKRIPIDAFSAQSRGGKGKIGAKMSTDEDMVSQFFSCQDHDPILFLTDSGKAFKIKAYKIPLASRTAKGVPIPQVLPISAEGNVTAIMPMEQFNEDDQLVLLTKKGFIKKTAMSAFTNLRGRSLRAMSVNEGDALIWVRKCETDSDILIATR